MKGKVRTSKYSLGTQPNNEADHFPHQNYISSLHTQGGDVTRFVNNKTLIAFVNKLLNTNLSLNFDVQ